MFPKFHDFWMLVSFYTMFVEKSAITWPSGNTIFAFCSNNFFQQAEYNSVGSPVRKILKRYNGLPFVDIPSITDILTSFRTEIDQLADGYRAKLIEFYDYFEGFWMVKISPQCLGVTWNTQK